MIDCVEIDMRCRHELYLMTLILGKIKRFMKNKIRVDTENILITLPVPSVSHEYFGGQTFSSRRPPWVACIGWSACQPRSRPRRRFRRPPCRATSAWRRGVRVPGPRSCRLATRRWRWARRGTAGWRGCIRGTRGPCAGTARLQSEERRCETGHKYFYRFTFENFCCAEVLGQG